VEAVVWTPEKLGQKEKKLLEELGDMEAFIPDEKVQAALQKARRK